MHRYNAVNARNSSRATSLKSLSRSIPDPLCTNSCNSLIVLPGAKWVSIVARMIFSGLFERVPALQALLVEANIGWIPAMLEQSDDMFLRYRWFTNTAAKLPTMPSRVFHRHFWATFMVDTVGIELRHRLNVDHLMWSTDYPHTGTDWPNSRMTIERVFAGVPIDEVRRMLHTNCKRLYRLDDVVPLLGCQLGDGSADEARGARDQELHEERSVADGEPSRIAPRAGSVIGRAMRDIR